MKMREKIEKLERDNAELQAKNERLDSEIHRLNLIIQDKLIPALISASDAMTAGRLLLTEISQRGYIPKGQENS